MYCWFIYSFIHSVVVHLIMNCWIDLFINFYLVLSCCLIDWSMPIAVCSHLMYTSCSALTVAFCAIQKLTQSLTYIYVKLTLFTIIMLVRSATLSVNVAFSPQVAGLESLRSQCQTDMMPDTVSDWYGVRCSVRLIWCQIQYQTDMVSDTVSDW